MDVGFGDEVPDRMTKDDGLLGPIMRVRKGRCIALRGVIGEHVRCAIYEDRPRVCREFEPGNEMCLWCRKREGLAVGTAEEVPA